MIRLRPLNMNRKRWNLTPQTIEMKNAAIIDVTDADSIPNGFAGSAPTARARVDDKYAEL
jgi:hypothetical protein